MKQLIFLIILVSLLFGCNPKESASISALPEQNLDANHTYLDVTITNLNIEDGKYFIYFEHNGVRGDIKAKASTTENLYKGLEEHISNKTNTEIKYDIIIDGDNEFILGISPSIKRHE